MASAVVAPVQVSSEKVEVFSHVSFEIVTMSDVQ